MKSNFSSLSRKLLTCFLIVSIFTACTPTIPKEALQLSRESLQLRSLQTRKFSTTNESKLLIAAAGVLQDLGYAIDESETSLGVIVGSKDRDATDAGQIAGAVVVAVLFGVATPVDQNQKIRASVVTTPVAKGTKLRVTFQRVVWNTQGQVSRSESLEDPKLYQGFFEALSKSVFLEAHKI
jgi:hypothetical protein